MMIGIEPTTQGFSVELIKTLDKDKQPHSSWGFLRNQEYRSTLLMNG
jgi:hypothetical protein